MINSEAIKNLTFKDLDGLDNHSSHMLDALKYGTSLGKVDENGFKHISDYNTEITEDVIGRVESFSWINGSILIGSPIEPIELFASPKFMPSSNKVLDYCIKEYNFLQFLFGKDTNEQINYIHQEGNLQNFRGINTIGNRPKLIIIDNL